MAPRFSRGITIVRVLVITSFWSSSILCTLYVAQVEFIVSCLVLRISRWVPSFFPIYTGSILDQVFLWSFKSRSK